MLIYTFLTAVTLHLSTPVDTVAVYSTLLAQLRAEYPSFPVVLAETESGVECMPLCGAGIRKPDRPAEAPTPIEPRDHSPGLIEALRARGLIDATCEALDLTFGCKDYPRHVFVGLGEIQERPVGGPQPVDGGVWVKVAVLVPCTTRCPSADSTDPYFPDGFGIWYLLKPEPTGEWRVERRRPAFFI